MKTRKTKTIRKGAVNVEKEELTTAQFLLLPKLSVSPLTIPCVKNNNNNNNVNTFDNIFVSMNENMAAAMMNMMFPGR